MAIARHLEQGNYEYVLLPFIPASNDMIKIVKVNNTNVIIEQNADYHNWYAYVTIQYTKASS